MDTRPEKETDPALRRSQSGFSTKVRILADRRGHPLCLRVTDDPRRDSTQAWDLAETWPDTPLFLSDRRPVYDADAFRAWLAQQGI